MSWYLDCSSTKQNLPSYWHWAYRIHVSLCLLLPWLPSSFSPSFSSCINGGGGGGPSSPYFSFYHASQVVLDSVIKTLMTARQSRVLQQLHKIYTTARLWTVLQGLDSEDLCCSHKDICSSHIVQTCRQTFKKECFCFYGICTFWMISSGFF